MALVVAGVCSALISVPFLALMALRLTSNQFVQETESALIQQGAIYAQVYRRAFEAVPGDPVGPSLDAKMTEFWALDLHPIRPQLNVRNDSVFPERPDGQPAALPGARHMAVLPGLRVLASEALRTTLTGVVFLDHNGVTPSDDGPLHFNDLPEVRAALKGQVGAVLRARNDYELHPLSSLSRDTGFRVFVTFPVVSENRVIGVVYLSRTPLNLAKFLFKERYALALMFAATALGAAVIGALLLRLVSRPVRGLRDQSHAIAKGTLPAPVPLPHYGMRELAELGESVITMADALSRRGKEISVYSDHVTHELKSPVTTIVGAAELLETPGLDDATRAGLAASIHRQGRRMEALLNRLRDMTKLRLMTPGKPAHLRDMVIDIKGLDTIVMGDATELPLSQEHGQIVLEHMAQNARAHGADRLELLWKNNVLRITDNGTGLPDEDMSRLTDPFFTTRREEGGTGMGLAIVTALLDIYGAVLVPLPNDGGAVFEIQFPERP